MSIILCHLLFTNIIKEREIQKHLPLHQRGRKLATHPRIRLQEELKSDERKDNGPQSLKDLSAQRRKDKLGEALDQLAITTRGMLAHRREISLATVK